MGTLLARCTMGDKASVSVTSYTFRAVLEPDEDVWAAYCPALVDKGVSTWGHTPEEALRNLQEVLQMVLESLRDHGEPLPEGDAVQISSEPRVTVNLTERGTP